jgi:predicted  nucleic acid-binding Zn-ribbon protein
VSWRDVVRLHDLDLLLEEAQAGGARERARRGGLPVGALERIEHEREQFARRLDRRWSHAYERARRRYGRAVVPVRERVCQGCYITLPTSATAHPEILSVCESCGRILFWH